MALFTSFLLSLGTALGIGSLTAGGAALSAFVSAGTALLQTAVGLGLNLIAQAVAGKPKKAGLAINGTLGAGGDTPRSFILGRTATAGSLVWANTWGEVDDTPNALLTQVIALEDLPGGAPVEIWVNGEKGTLGSAGSLGQGFRVNEFTKDGQPNFWVKYYDGTQVAADSFLTTYASNANRTWESTRVGIGVAYAIITARVTRNIFSGIPTAKFVRDGIPLYDISKDSSVGGSGSQRWNNPATWGGDGDDLVAVQAYNVLRGIQYGGEWFYGLQGMTAARLPADNWVAAVAKCRSENYKAGAEIPIDAPLSTTLEALMTACQGRITEIGGEYRMYLGSPDAPTFAFTDDDILSTDEQSFTPFFGLADTINGVIATYPSPADGWTEKTAPPYYRTDLEAKHGGRRLMADVSLSFVPYPEQVQRLIKSAVLEAQRERRHTIALPPAFWAYAVPGEICSWTSERNGYISKLFRIDGVIDRANLDVVIDITEVDPDDYDWDSGSEFHPPVDGALGPIRPAPQPIIDWSATAATITDNTGADRRPAILLEWDNTAGRLDDVIGIEFEVRLDVTLTSIYKGRTDQPDVGSILISQGLLPDTDYEVRGRYIPGTDRDVLWSSWLDVTTPHVLQTDISVVLGSLQPDVYQTILQLNQQMDEVRARIEQVAMSALDAAGTQQAQTSVAVRHFNAYAVALTGSLASVEEVGGALQAIAETYLAVEGTVGGQSANGLIQMSAQAGVGDVVAQISLQTRASIDGTFTGAGLVAQSGFTGGNPLLPFNKILFYADQTIFTDATGTEISMAIVGGKLYVADLIAETSNLGTAAITDKGVPVNNVDYSIPPGTINVAENDVLHTFSISSPEGHAVFFDIFATLQVGRGSTAGNIRIRLRLTNTTTAATVYLSAFLTTSGTTSLGLSTTVSLMKSDLPNVGTNNYELSADFSYDTGTTSPNFDCNDVVLRWQQNKR